MLNDLRSLAFRRVGCGGQSINQCDCKIIMIMAESSKRGFSNGFRV